VRFTTVTFVGFDSVPQEVYMLQDTGTFHVLALLENNDDEKISGREQLSILQDMADISDIVLLNGKENYSVTETILLYSVYSNKTPIIQVGGKEPTNYVLKEMICNRKESVNDAVKYLLDNYA